MTTKRKNSRLRRRGIYLLPSAFTVANIFCGFYSIICAIRGDLALGGLLIGGAILLDTLDGRVARFANASSEFGKEFDSLADQVSFGVAPMVLAYQWGLHLWPRMGWLVGFLFVICGAMRLARFNIQQSATDKRFFVGLPIPAAAGVIAALIYRFPELLETRRESLPVMALVLILSLLMVSKVRYYSFKDFDIRRRQPHLVILFVALFFVAIFTHPQAVLLTMSSTYLLSGLAHKLWTLLAAQRAGKNRPAAAAAEPSASSLEAELDVDES